MFGKVAWTKETRPDIAEKISRVNIERSVNVGDRNGMKKPEARAKASASAKKKFENPEMRLLTANGVSRAWARGDFDGVRVGQCEWHEYTKRDGTTIRLQGFWELEFAKYLDHEGINFCAHVGRLSYTDNDGNERSYYPDFYLFNGTYIDVKNPYYEMVHAEKIEAVRRANPEITLLVYGKEKLKELGLRLTGV